MRRGKVLTQTVSFWDWAQAERFRALARTLLGARVQQTDLVDGKSVVHTGRLTPGQVEILYRLSARTLVELTWDDYLTELYKTREETIRLLEDLTNLCYTQQRGGGESDQGTDGQAVGGGAGEDG